MLHSDQVELTGRRRRQHTLGKISYGIEHEMQYPIRGNREFRATFGIVFK